MFQRRFFSYFYGTKISINFVDVCWKPTVCIHFNTIRVSFQVVLWPVSLILHNLYLCLHVSWFLFVCTLITAGKSSQQHFPKFNSEIINRKCGILSKLAMKTGEKRQCFLMSPCHWGRSGGYICTWICFNIYLSIIHLIWCTGRHTMRRTRVSPNVTQSTTFSWTCF